MTNLKISQLTTAVPAAADLLPFVDVDDTSTTPAGSAGSDKAATVAGLAVATASALAPTGATAETYSRRLATGTSSATLTSGSVYVQAILLPAGLAVNTITLFTAAGNVVTAADLTHGWYALLDSTLTVRAVSADQIAVSFLTAQNTAYPLSVAASAYTTTYSGLYYIAESTSVSAASMPQFATDGAIGVGVGSVAPVLQGTAGSQAAPPTTGTQLAGGTVTFSNSNALYAYTS